MYLSGRGIPNGKPVPGWRFNMFDLLDPQTFWLNVTNIGLGIATLVCCLVIVLALFDDIAEHLKGASLP